MGPPDPRQCLPLRGELRGRSTGTDFGAVEETKAQRKSVAMRGIQTGPFAAFYAYYVRNNLQFLHLYTGEPNSYYPRERKAENGKIEFSQPE